jgi:Holliday junction resolvasome RuvABC ATP-dependent DNA helicase subunit
MIGLSNFKNSILDQILYFVQDLHHGKEPDFMHTVLSGPPGTGKTEIAKILGKMYSKIGILKNGVFKKVTRSDLVAGYLGQTAIKTSKVITECLGGCLFIDEAYSLANDYDDNYSRECLDTLCEALSNHKGELMVIIAGYEDELNNTFFKANQGLRSRFIWRFNIDDYSVKELMEIFILKITCNDWKISVEQDQLLKWFQSKRVEFKSFGRDMELLFSFTKISHGRRIYGKPIEVRKHITLEDLDNGFKCFQKNLDKKNEKRTELFGLYV